MLEHSTSNRNLCFNTQKVETSLPPPWPGHDLLDKLCFNTQKVETSLPPPWPGHDFLDKSMFNVFIIYSIAFTIVNYFVIADKFISLFKISFLAYRFLVNGVCLSLYFKSFKAMVSNHNLRS